MRKIIKYTKRYDKTLKRDIIVQTTVYLLLGFIPVYSAELFISFA